MSRLRLLVALTAVAGLMLAGAAVAKVTKVTGGTTSITLSAAASKVLADNHLTATPLAPATASGSTFSFPIARGRLNAKRHGLILTRGGFALSNGTSTVALRRLAIRSTRAGVSLWALVRRRTHRHRAVVARIARITKVTVNGHSATGTVDLTAKSAGVINRLAGKHVVNAGAPIGTATIAVTMG